MGRANTGPGEAAYNLLSILAPKPSITVTTTATASLAYSLENGAYDVLIVGDVGSEWRRIFVVTGSYTITPPSGSSTFTKAVFYGPYSLSRGTSAPASSNLTAGYVFNAVGGQTYGSNLPVPSEIVTAATSSSNDLNAGSTPVHQGIAENATYRATIHTDALHSRDKSDWANVLDTNTSPFTGLSGTVNHLGDGAFMSSSRLLVPVENYNGGTITGSNHQFAVYDYAASGLPLVQSAAMPGVVSNDAIAGIACDTASGVIYGIVYKTASCPRLYKWRLSDFSLIEVVSLSWSASYNQAQGLAYNASTGLLYVACKSQDDVKRIVACSTSGVIQYTLSVQDVIVRDQEGVEMDPSGSLLMLDNWGSNSDIDAFVRYVTLPTNMAASATAAGWYTGGISGRRSLRLQGLKPATAFTLVIIAKVVTRAATRSLWDNGRGGNTAKWKGTVASDGAVTGRAANANVLSYAAGVSAGQQLFYAFAYDQSTGARSLYAQGAMRGTTADAAADVFPTNGEIALGGEGYPTNQPGDLVFEAVYVFDKMLSEAELQAIEADPASVWAAQNALRTAQKTNIDAIYGAA